jgi:hypothetical protein
MLTNNLRSILPESRLSTCAILDDMFNAPGKKPHVREMVREAVAHTNALAFFGQSLGMYSAADITKLV